MATIRHVDTEEISHIHPASAGSGVLQGFWILLALLPLLFWFRGCNDRREAEERAERAADSVAAAERAARRAEAASAPRTASGFPFITSAPGKERRAFRFDDYPRKCFEEDVDQWVPYLMGGGGDLDVFYRGVKYRMRESKWIDPLPARYEMNPDGTVDREWTFCQPDHKSAERIEVWGIWY